MSLTILEEPYEFSLSGNPIIVAVNTTLGNAPGVKVKISVYIEEQAFGATFDLLYTEELTPDVNGNVIFELQNNVQAALKWNVPNWFAAYEMVSNGVRQYSYNVEEYDSSGYTGSYIDNQSGNIPIGNPIVYKGGLPKEMYKKRWFFKQFLDKGLAPSGIQQGWWTYTEKHVKVGIYQPQWLMFQNNLATGYIAQVNLSIFVGWDDGTSSTVTNRIPELESTNTPPLGSLWCFAVGVDQLQLQAIQPNKKIAYYSIQLMENGGSSPISDKMFYDVSYDYANRERSLIFNNSINGFESVRLFFQEQIGINITEQIGERQTSITAPGANRIVEHESFSYNIFAQEQRIANTGELRQSDAYGLQQLDLAEVIYEVCRSPLSAPLGLGTGLIYLPIQRTTLKVVLDKRLPDSVPYSHTIEYAVALKNNSYAPRFLGNNTPMAKAYQYTFSIPTLPSGHVYGFSTTPGFFDPSGIGAGYRFNNVNTLLLWIQFNWQYYGYWSINNAGELQLDSNYNYGTIIIGITTY